MIEESELNILVSNVISENRYSHCRLCLKTIQDHYVRLQDCVSIDANRGYFQVLSEVLAELLGPEISEDIVGLDAVCMECVDKTLETQKFLLNCRNATTVLHNIFDNLTNTLNIDIENPNTDHSLYITVAEFESKLILTKNDDKSKPVTPQSEVFTCTECFEEVDDIIDLKVHNLTTHFTFTCDKCLFTSADDAELTSHQNSEQMFTCDYCDTRRCTRDSLRVHQDNAHELYVCKDCGKAFTGLEKLQAHEHKHLSKSECPKCGKSYNTKEFFLKHVKLCMEDLLDPHPMRSKIEKTYFCDKCGKGYSTPGGLRVHHRFVHGNAKPHVCKFCNKQFTAPSYLKVHMVKHTGEKNFKCDICTRKFVSKEALLYHTRRHTGEKPYSCTMCDEKFVNSSARAEHIKFKHVGPTLMCEICSRKFVTATFLRQHMKKHHDPSNKLYTGRSLIPPNVPAVENMRVRFID
ncbi:unnamed protein product [Arctia plantaginis]|uniref:Uncharacterized protein n=1 Tax=Arctia plantaginis TaxID=874455 RepID=A0A8S0ZWC4_ARCPL|nr:unnamed protein product [Arctia plantaginis]